MERVLKRFYLHNTRDKDQIRESDFDQLKQDVQTVKIEMLNDIKRAKTDALKYVKMIHNGVSILGEFIFKSMNDFAHYELDNFRNFQLYEKVLIEDLEDSMITKCRIKHFDLKTNQQIVTENNLNGLNIYDASKISQSKKYEKANQSLNKAFLSFTDLNSISEEK